MVLPCKKVYEPTWDAGEDCDLACPDLLDTASHCELCPKGVSSVYERKCVQDDIKRIGKTVFLTREAAEAALAAKVQE